MMGSNDKEAFREAFAERFCRALKELGYAPHQQKELGRLFGVSGQAAQKWAEGIAMPSLTRMHHVAEVLGVKRVWLQDGEGPMRSVVGTPANEGKEVESIPISDDEIDLLLVYRQLTPQQRKVVKSVVAVLQEDNSEET